MNNQPNFPYHDFDLPYNYQYNLDDQCNVAYNNTSSDLCFGATSFLKGQADKVLFPGCDTASMYAISPATENMATVSPQELSMNYASAPPSAAIPELTMDDTPMLSNGIDTPMFPEYSPAFTDNMEPPVTTPSSELAASPMLEDQPTTSSKKRGGKLKELKPDPNDLKAVMRARNTAAARKSRRKKILEVEELKAQVADLQAQLAASQAEVAQLKAQNPLL